MLHGDREEETAPTQEGSASSGKSGSHSEGDFCRHHWCCTWTGLRRLSPGDSFLHRLCLGHSLLPFTSNNTLSKEGVLLWEMYLMSFRAQSHLQVTFGVQSSHPLVIISSLHLAASSLRQPLCVLPICAPGAPRYSRMFLAFEVGSAGLGFGHMAL